MIYNIRNIQNIIMINTDIRDAFQKNNNINNVLTHDDVNNKFIIKYDNNIFTFNINEILKHIGNLINNDFMKNFNTNENINAIFNNFFCKTFNKNYFDDCVLFDIFDMSYINNFNLLIKINKSICLFNDSILNIELDNILIDDEKNNIYVLIKKFENAFLLKTLNIINNNFDLISKLNKNITNNFLLQYCCSIVYFFSSNVKSLNNIYNKKIMLYKNNLDVLFDLYTKLHELYLNNNNKKNSNNHYNSSYYQLSMNEQNISFHTNI
jgi:hypothetical protein